jgi:hypothetical protein
VEAEVEDSISVLSSRPQIGQVSTLAGICAPQLGQVVRPSSGFSFMNRSLDFRPSVG